MRSLDSLTVDEISSLLRAANLGVYAEAFARVPLSGADLALVNESDLVGFDVHVPLHRKRILHLMATYAAEGVPPHVLVGSELVAETSGPVRVPLPASHSSAPASCAPTEGHLRPTRAASPARAALRKAREATSAAKARSDAAAELRRTVEAQAKSSTGRASPSAAAASAAAQSTAAIRAEIEAAVQSQRPPLAASGPVRVSVYSAADLKTPRAANAESELSPQSSPEPMSAVERRVRARADRDAAAETRARELRESAARRAGAPIAPLELGRISPSDAVSGTAGKLAGDFAPSGDGIGHGTLVDESLASRIARRRQDSARRREAESPRGQQSSSAECAAPAVGDMLSASSLQESLAVELSGPDGRTHDVHVQTDAGEPHDYAPLRLSAPQAFGMGDAPDAEFEAVHVAAELTYGVDGDQAEGDIEATSADVTALWHHDFRLGAEPTTCASYVAPPTSGAVDQSSAAGGWPWVMPRLVGETSIALEPGASILLEIPDPKSAAPGCTNLTASAASESELLDFTLFLDVQLASGSSMETDVALSRDSVTILDGLVAMALGRQTSPTATSLVSETDVELAPSPGEAAVSPSRALDHHQGAQRESQLVCTRLRLHRWHRVVIVVDARPSDDHLASVHVYVDGELTGQAAVQPSVLRAIWPRRRVLKLFGGPGTSNGAHMPADVGMERHCAARLAAVQLLPTALDAAAVKARTHVHWAFDADAAMRELALRKTEMRRLTLGSVYSGGPAPPLWHSAPFLAEMADPFLSTGGSLECDISLAALAKALHRLHSACPHGIDRELTTTQLESIKKVAVLLDSARSLWKSYADLVAAVLKAASELARATLAKRPRCTSVSADPPPLRARAQFVEKDVRTGMQLLDTVVDAAMKAITKFVADGRPMILLPAGWICGDNCNKSWYFVALVLEPEDLELPSRSFRLTVCNGGGEGIEWHGASAAAPPKVKFRGSITLNGVRAERLRDEAFWTMLYGSAGHLDNRSPKTGAAMLYSTLLPWLIEQPLTAALASQDASALGDYRTPMYSDSSHYRSLLEVVRCILRRGGLDHAQRRHASAEAHVDALSKGQVKLVTFCLRSTFVSMARADLRVVRSVSQNDRELLDIATRQLALAAVKAADAGHLPPEELGAVHLQVEGVSEAMDEKPQVASAETFTPLSLNNMETGRLGASLIPYLDRLLHTDVRGKEGAPLPLPKELAVDFLRVGERVRTAAELSFALRQSEKLCLQLSCLDEAGAVRHAAFLKTSLLQHVFTHIVPVPIAAGAERTSRSHPWDFGPHLKWGQQLELLLLLQRLSEHFAAAVFSCKASKSLDGVKTVVLGAMAAACDYLLRQKAVDHVSVVTKVLLGEHLEPELRALDPEEFMKRQRGRRAGKHPGFGIGASLFLQQSSTYEVVSPELNVARADVFNYFLATQAHEDSTLFAWENDGWSMEPPQTDMEFSRTVAACCYRDVSRETQATQFSGEDSFIVHNFAEFRALRDVTFWWKYTQCSDSDVFPSVRNYPAASATLRWELSSLNDVYGKSASGACFEVTGLGLGRALTRRGTQRNSHNDLSPEPTLSGLRWGSDSSPNDERLELGSHVENETDVLHVKTMPSFDGTLGQADSELLVSFLTVPYLRLPLVVQFFSSHNRLHALASPEVRRILAGVLLEPGRCEPVHLRGKAPQHVPAIGEEKEMLGTPYGSLLNECARSPHLVPASMVELLRQVIQLGAQPYRCKTTVLVLCVVGLFVHLESAVHFLLQLWHGTHPSISLDFVAGLRVSLASKARLAAHYETSQTLLHTDVRRVLLRWLHELETASADAMVQRPEEVDAICRDQCVVHANLVLTLRNTPIDPHATGDSTWSDVEQLLCSFLFLQRRHTWNAAGLPVPESEIYEIMHLRRPDVVSWINNVIADTTDTASSSRLARVERLQRLLHNVFVAGTGSEDYETRWAAYQGEENRGRYAASIRRKGSTRPETSRPGEIMFISERDLPVEVNLQLMQVTMRGEFLMALDGDIARDADMVRLFGDDCSTMQCAMMGNYENMRDRRLVSLPFALQAWAPDRDLPFMPPGRIYKPDELEPCEAWVAEVFEPCRKSELNTKKGPLTWMFHNKEESLPEAAQVAILTGLHPDQKKPWKEAVVYKTMRVVQVFALCSHGRRWFRHLEYTSNAKLSLHALQPSVQDQQRVWPRWARHQADDGSFQDTLSSLRPPAFGQSLVLLRNRAALPPSRLASKPENTGVGHGLDVGNGLDEVAAVDALGAASMHADRAVSAEPVAQRLPQDEWTPIVGNFTEPAAAGALFEDSGLGRAIVSPPPSDVVEMLRRRTRRLSSTLSILQPLAAAASMSGQFSSLRASVGAASGSSGNLPPTLRRQPCVLDSVREAGTGYIISAVEEYAPGVEPLRVSVDKADCKEVVIGLDHPVTGGRAMFEVVIKRATAFRVGWMPIEHVLIDDKERDMSADNGSLDEKPKRNCDGVTSSSCARNSVSAAEDDAVEVDGADHGPSASAAGTEATADAASLLTLSTPVQDGVPGVPEDRVLWGLSWTCEHGCRVCTNEAAVGAAGELEPGQSSPSKDSTGSEVVELPSGTWQAPCADGDVLSVAADLETGALFFAKNGQWLADVFLPCPTRAAALKAGVCAALAFPEDAEIGLHLGSSNAAGKHSSDFEFPRERFTPLSRAVQSSGSAERRQSILPFEKQGAGLSTAFSVFALCSPNPPSLPETPRHELKQECLVATVLRGSPHALQPAAEGAELVGVRVLAAHSVTPASLPCSGGQMLLLPPLSQVRSGARKLQLLAADAPTGGEGVLKVTSVPIGCRPRSDSGSRENVQVANDSDNEPEESDEDSDSDESSFEDETDDEGKGRTRWWERLGVEPEPSCFTLQAAPCSLSSSSEPVGRFGGFAGFEGRLHTGSLDGGDDDDDDGDVALDEVAMDADELELLARRADEQARSLKSSTGGAPPSLGRAAARAKLMKERGERVHLMPRVEALDDRDGGAELCLELVRYVGHRRQRWVLTPLAREQSIELSTDATAIVSETWSIASEARQAESSLERALSEQRAWEAQQRSVAKVEGEMLEQYLPPLSLEGLLPAALLETHDFYQDLSSPRLIRGYPIPVSLNDEHTDKDVALAAERRAREFRLFPQETSAYTHMIKLTLYTLPREHALTDMFAGSRTFGRVERRYAGAFQSGNHVLLSLMHASEGSQLLSLARTLSGVEALSHILVWARAGELGQVNSFDSGGDDMLGLVPDLVELPRLKLRLRVEVENGDFRLYSADHGKLFVPDTASESEHSDSFKGGGPARALAACIPHALLLSSSNHEYSLVVPNVMPVRPSIGDQPFSTDLVLVRNGDAAERWAQNATTRYFTYGVHVSGAFLQPPTLASALYLLVLRLLARDYEGASTLIGAISTDGEMSEEESQIFDLLGHIRDGHPDLSAVRCRIMLAEADSHVPIPWDVRKEQSAYVTKLSHVSARCRLAYKEERAALVLCDEALTKLELVKKHASSLDDRVSSVVSRLIAAELTSMKAVFDERKPLAEYLQAMRVEFLAKGLRCTDVELMRLFVDVKSRGAKMTMPRHFEDVLWNRDRLLETVQEEEKKLRAVDPDARHVAWVGESAGTTRTRSLQADCNIRAPKPPSGGGSDWVAIKLDSAPRGEHVKLEQGVVSYRSPPSSCTKAEMMLKVLNTISRPEELKGSGSGLGFLWLYEHLTGTKEVVFRGNKQASAAANRTLAAIVSSFFKDTMGSSLQASIINTMWRNPWICPAMPKWEDTRSDSWSYSITYRGWSEGATLRSIPVDDPLSRLLFRAQETLVKLENMGFLLSDDLPPYGFTPPVEIRPSLPLLLHEPPLTRAAVRLLPSGAKSAKGELLPPDQKTALELVATAAAAASGEQEITMRWVGPLKGLVQRSNQPCAEQSDYARGSFGLQPLPHHEAFDSPTLLKLLGQPLLTPQVEAEILRVHEPSDPAADTPQSWDRSRANSAPTSDLSDRAEYFAALDDAHGAAVGGMCMPWHLQYSTSAILGPAPAGRPRAPSPPPTRASRQSCPPASAGANVQRAALETPLRLPGSANEAQRGVRGKLPFELTPHPEAQSGIAASYLRRIEVDYEKFMRRPQGGRALPGRSGRPPSERLSDIHTLSPPEAVAELRAATAAITRLRAVLTRMSEADRRTVARAQAQLLDSANAVQLDEGGADEQEISSCSAPCPAHAAAEGDCEGDDTPFVPEEEEEGATTQGDHLMARKAGRRAGGGVPVAVPLSPSVAPPTAAPQQSSAAPLPAAPSPKRRLTLWRGATESSLGRRHARPVEPGAVDWKQLSEAYRYLLLRHSRHESSLWYEYLVGCLLSRLSTEDLRKLNPFLSDREWDELQNQLAATLLTANRVVHANRAIDACDDASKLLAQLHTTAAAAVAAHGAAESLPSSTGRISEGDAIELQLKIDRLLELLATGREFSAASVARRAADATQQQIYDSLRSSEPASPSKVAKMNDHLVARRAEANSSEAALTIDPRFLAFEFIWNLQLRARQVDLVLECVSAAHADGSIVKQMIMGAGKTSVVSPLISLLLAQGDYLVVQCMPAALLPMSFSILRTTFSSAIQKRVYNFVCDRATLGKPSIYAKLASARDKAAVVITTPQAVKSLMLNFVESLTVATDGSDSRYRDPELRASAKVWADVLSLFRHGACIMDEVDLVLHPLRSELNFPIGTKEKLDFTDEGQRWQLPMALFDALLFAQECATGRNEVEAMPARLTGGLSVVESERAIVPLMRALVETIRRGFECAALQSKPHLIMLREDFYVEPGPDRQRSLQTILAEWLIPFLRRKEVEPPATGGLSDGELVKYITNHRGVVRDEETRRTFERRLSGPSRKWLNLARDWLGQFLPHALRKIDRVTFGILNESDLKHAQRTDPMMPRSRAKLAIPFISKDVPAPASEFAQPDVVIGLTTLAYRIEGLRLQDFAEAFDKLMQDFESETGRFDQRHSAEIYADWVALSGGCVQVARHSSATTHATDENGNVSGNGDGNATGLVAMPLELLDRSDDLQTGALFDAFRKLPEFIHWYLEQIVFPTFMKFQETKLSASGEDMGGAMLFKRRIGFSGTPSELLPREFNGAKCDFEPGSEGECVHTLTTPRVVGAVTLPKEWDADSVLSFVASSVDETGAPRFHALIDVGALITGKTNEEVAAALVSKPASLPGVKGVVFLDKFDQKRIFMRDTHTILRLEESSVREGDYFVFYDQIHTTGMDIRHRLTARAALTLGKDSTWRDYAQGAYRMRGIAKGQTVQLLLTPEVWELVERDAHKVSRAREIGHILKKRAAAERQCKSPTAERAEGGEGGAEPASTTATFHSSFADGPDEADATSKRVSHDALLGNVPSPQQRSPSHRHSRRDASLVTVTTPDVKAALAREPSRRLSRQNSRRSEQLFDRFDEFQLSAARQLVEEAVACAPVVVIGEAYCPACGAAKELLQHLGVDFTFVRVSDAELGYQPPCTKAAVIHVLSADTGSHSFPAVYMQGEYFGGASDALSSFISGSLVPLLAQRELLVDPPAPEATDDSKKPVPVAAWLQLQQIRSEKIQFQMLQLQNLADVWRVPAFTELLTSYEANIVEDGTPEEGFREGLRAFHEEVEMSVEAHWPTCATLKQIFDKKTSAHERWVRQADPAFYASSDAQVAPAHNLPVEAFEAPQGIVHGLLHAMRGLADEGVSSFGALEQCMECEHQKEQEKELEQQTEMEKAVEVAFSQGGEEGTSWQFERLRELHGLLGSGAADSCATSGGSVGSRAHAHFYPASKFHLHGRKPLRLPGRVEVGRLQPIEDVHVSTNHFDPQWSGERRLRNVTILLEWLPNRRNPAPHSSDFAPDGPGAEPVDGSEAPAVGPSGRRSLGHSLDEAVAELRKLLQLEPDESLSTLATRLVLTEAFDTKLDESDVRAAVQAVTGRSATTVTTESLKALLCSREFRAFDDGRRFVLVSLAEAETIRRVMHAREETNLIDGAATAIALRSMPMGGELMEASLGFEEGPAYQRSMAVQLSRFLDGQMFYEPSELSTLVKLLQLNSFAERQHFFTRLCGCRRRYSSKWSERPVAGVLRDVQTEFSLLIQRIQARAMRLSLRRDWRSIDDAFRCFDVVKDSELTPAETLDMLLQLGLPHEPQDVLRFIVGADRDENHAVSLKEFRKYLASFRGGDETDCAEFDSLFAGRAPGEVSEEERQALHARLAEAVAGHRRATEAEQAARKLGYERMKEEMEESAEASADPNPAYMDKEQKWRWDFARRKLPRLVGHHPADGRPVPVKVAPQVTADMRGSHLLKIPRASSLLLDTSTLHQQLADDALASAWAQGDARSRVNAYSVTAVVRWPSRPPRADRPFPLLSLRRPVTNDKGVACPLSSAEMQVGAVVLHSDGQLGVSVGACPADAVVDDGRGRGECCGERAAGPRAWECWPQDWMDCIVPDCTRSCRLRVSEGEWQVVTLSVNLGPEGHSEPPAIQVFCNGELALEINSAHVQSAARAAATAQLARSRSFSDTAPLAGTADGFLAGVAFGIQAELTESARRRSEGLESAIRPNGPFSLAPDVGFCLFGDYTACSAGRASEGESGGLVKFLKAVTLAPRAAAVCDVWVEHTAYGVWRCRSCSHTVRCTGSQQCAEGFRNGPDARCCANCLEPRPQSQDVADPSGKANAAHPGLWTATAANFEAEVIEADADAFVLFSADWCPPSRVMKPDWYELARLLADCDDVRICLLDTDLNQSNPKYYWEGSIPTLKLFLKGRKQHPLTYSGERKLAPMMEWLSQNASKPSAEGASSLLDAQYLSYSRKHELPRRLAALLRRLSRARAGVEEPLQRSLAESGLRTWSDDDWRMWQASNLKEGMPTACGRATLERAHQGNWERWFSALASDPEVFADEPYVAELQGVSDAAFALVEREPGDMHAYESQLERMASDDSTGLTRHILHFCRSLLVDSRFPPRPLEAIALGVARETPVVCSPTSPKFYFNVPPSWQLLLLSGRVTPWKRAPSADPMAAGSTEARRAWPSVLDALKRPLLARSADARSREMHAMADDIAELVRQGMPVDAQPEGDSLVHLCAAAGDDFLPLLNQLFWSGADMAALNPLDLSMPIEVAASMGYAVVVKRLHSMGCPVGRALFCAVAQSQIEVIHLLLGELAVPVDVRWPAAPNVSPLELAVIIGSTEVAALLMESYGASASRELSPAACRTYGLAPQASIAHLCAKLGGSRGKLLGLLVNHEGTLRQRRDGEAHSLFDIAAPHLIKGLDRRRFLCWEVLHATLLSPAFDRDDPAAVRSMCRQLQEAVRNGGDAACPNDVGWTCLMVASLVSEPAAADALLAGKSMRDAPSAEAEAEASRVLYATSSSGLTALMWAHWLAWLTGSTTARELARRDASAAAAAAVAAAARGPVRTGSREVVATELDSDRMPDDLERPPSPVGRRLARSPTFVAAIDEETEETEARQTSADDDALARSRCAQHFSHVEGDTAFFHDQQSGRLVGRLLSNLGDDDRRHIRAVGMVDAFSLRGATLRGKDKLALARLKAAYCSASPDERSLLLFDPAHFRMAQPLHVPSEDEIDGVSLGFQLRQCEGGGTRSALHVPQFFADDYCRTCPSLESFLRGLGDKNEAYSHQNDAGEHVLWAKEFDGRMDLLLASAKLFVQDKIATGCALSARHIFALHVYTLQSSVFVDANQAMRLVDPLGIERWRPFIYHLTQAIDTLNCRSTTVFRGLHLWKETNGTVANFLDGNWPPDATPAARPAHADARWAVLRGDGRDPLQDDDMAYHVGRTVLWPSFSSCSTDPTIALAYATKNLDRAKGHAAVVFKIRTQRACPIREYSYYPFEEELLYRPNTAFRVNALLEPTSANMRVAGRDGATGTFACDTNRVPQRTLSLAEAKARDRVLIELHEVPL